LTGRDGAFSLAAEDDEVALGFGRSKSEDVLSLIAAKDYGRAIEVLRAQLKKRGASTTLRKQLADVLELSGKTHEAVALLLPLADQFAREGFAAKAVAVLKKIQKIDPGRRDVEERLAQVIEEKQREAVVLPFSNAPEIGIEEIGIEPPRGASLPAAVEAPPAGRAPTPEPTGAAGPEAEISIGTTPPATTAPAAPVAPVSVAPDPAPASDSLPSLSPPAEPLPVLTPPFGSSAADAAAPPSRDATPAAGGEKAPGGTKPPSAAAGDEIEDYDLLYQGDEGDEDDDEVVIEVEALAEAPPMTDGAFADELMSLVDTVFQESPVRDADAPGAAATASGSQIVVSPLFRDFAVDEMVAVIQGLKLLSFERGEVILREGSRGASLYTLTSGRVRAFRKDAATGKQQPLGDLKEGAFFGEMSILTGQPRMASVVALTRCELLELDRSALDDITQRHPHVWDVLREFAEKRSPPRG
jgi:outer membrane PBP1 activator LpoA protein